ncbi:hypothetical protein [Lysinibacillus sp. SGAir0095]|uniref:hypothetical protein n=1 Tax=Lysinibacillus sp. SGAir0095 TaxID=2070463 RepID=UPI0010CD5D58|nr:hypothetical protein [Lysinibacillus sp. SGAir0095]QCR31326.1 hypothetical protein C1N55_03740 [Lysinibacillus sp. SGAir0095]
MQWQYKIRYLMGQPIGISLANGQGTSGILCGVSDGKLLVMEYMYQTQYAMKQYDFDLIQDISAFPPCNQQRFY